MIFLHLTTVHSVLQSPIKTIKIHFVRDVTVFHFGEVKKILLSHRLFSFRETTRTIERQINHLPDSPQFK